MGRWTRPQPDERISSDLLFPHRYRGGVVKTIQVALLQLFALSIEALAQSEGVAEFRGSTSIPSRQSIPSHSRVSFSGTSARVDVDVDMSAVTGGSGSPDAYKMT